MRGRVNLLLHKVIDSFILRLQELEGTNIIIAIVIARPPSIHPSLHLHISYGEELDEQRQQQSNMGLASATISSSDLIDAKLGARSTHCPGCGHKLVKPGEIQGSIETKLSQLRSTKEFTSIERDKNIPDVLVPWIRQILQRAGPRVR